MVGTWERTGMDHTQRYEFAPIARWKQHSHMMAAGCLFFWYMARRGRRNRHGRDVHSAESRWRTARSDTGGESDADFGFSVGQAGSRERSTALVRAK